MSKLKDVSMLPSIDMPIFKEAVEYWFDRTQERRDVLHILSEDDSLYSLCALLCYASRDQVKLPEELLYRVLKELSDADELYNLDLRGPIVSDYMEEFYGHTWECPMNE